MEEPRQLKQFYDYSKFEITYTPLKCIRVSRLPIPSPSPQFMGG
jgi:hypothetical protein